MSGIDETALDDLVAGTLSNYGPPDIEQIAQKLQNYFVSTYFMKKDNHKIKKKGGIDIKEKVMIGRTETAEFKGLYGKDNVTLGNYLQTITVPWCHISDGWPYELIEIAENVGEALLANIIKPRRANVMLSILEQLESKFFGSAPASTDTLNPYGLKYWVVSNSSAGFNGGAPLGHTTVGGINPTTYSRWKNYTDQYTNITEDDLFDRMRKASFKTGFQSPIDIDSLNNPTQLDNLIFSSFDTYSSFVKEAKKQNDQVGSDLDRYHGITTFQKIPIVPVAQLTDNSDHDVYMINFDSFKMACLDTRYMVESKPKEVKDSHNARQVFIDLSMNWICMNRRLNSVIKVA